MLTARACLRTLALALAATFAAAALTAAPAAHAAPTAAELAKDRLAAAEKTFRSAAVSHKAGRVPLEVVYSWSVRWLDAALDAAPKTAKQALADHAKRMAELDTEVQKLTAAGTASSLDADAAGYYRIEAELWAARGKR